MTYLAFRNLFQQKFRLALSIGGVALAMTLIVLLNGFLTGIYVQVAAYLDNTPADLIVAQDGVTNLLSATSMLPASTEDLARGVPGIDQLIPIVSQFVIMDIHDEKVVAYMIGYEPDAGGGPWILKAGRPPADDDEVVLDWVMADTHGFGLGDTVEILDEDFTIVGLTRGLTSIINSVTFIRLEDFQELRGDEAVSYALLKVKPGYDPAQIAEAITARNPDDVLALTQADFAREEKQIIKDMSVEVLNLMNASGLLIGLAVTALTLYTSTLSKRQEYGVLKAIGAKNRHLFRVVIAQAFLSLFIGFALAIGLVGLMGLVLPQFIAGFHLALTGQSIIRVLVASLVIGVVAVSIPTWQIARLDPARVFRN